MTKAFEASVDVEDAGTAVVALRGELDLRFAPQLEAALRTAELEGGEVIVVDLRELQFMDSTGLNSLLRAQHRARADGRRLVVVRGNENIQHLFHVAGLTDRLTFVDEP